MRVSNQVAVNMYKQLGYSVYRTVIEYYSASNGEPDEDAYGELPSGAVSGEEASTYLHPTDRNTLVLLKNKTKTDFLDLKYLKFKL